MQIQLKACDVTTMLGRLSRELKELDEVTRDSAGAVLESAMFGNKPWWDLHGRFFKRGPDIDQKLTQIVTLQAGVLSARLQSMLALTDLVAPGDMVTLDNEDMFHITAAKSLLKSVRIVSSEEFRNRGQ